MTETTSAVPPSVSRAPAQARVLIATDSLAEAQQIEHLLEDHFTTLRSSTEPDRAVKDFDAYKPDVLVLAFDTLEKAQNYYLGLYRFSQILAGHAHRTVVLCTKEEVRAAFDLCKKRYFDDYVLFWPLIQDGLRLPMSIWVACREMTAPPDAAPARAEWVAHTKHLRTLESKLAREWSNGEERVGIARSSMVELEQQLARESDEFSKRLVRGGDETGVEVKHPDRLAREIERLKSRQLEQARRVRVQGVEPLGEWARGLKRELEPSLAGTRALTETVRAIRPIVMVVEDDDFSQELIARALGSQAYQLLFVGDAAAASRELQRVRPDVILMDVRLPGVDGVTLTRRLKATANCAKVPIIMMSGDARGETLRNSIEAGAADFVVKPFTTEALTSKIENVLSR
jgi:CheY-like chemotaxis protein